MPLYGSTGIQAVRRTQQNGSLRVAVLGVFFLTGGPFQKK
ncbi:hypothetical protein LEP1GSC016_0484 [Leptospira borgpetersenii serovar Hardjo-bovis str. Sponselee]|uniref:Uncharacterized protein n=2 Tax=Leptospira borgpetersenii TaxID=174 RepID=M6BVZ1_LEPBO|nr:hypothetical protein LEP1GSC016_0484 [Leptospira borgpetersenii serovar Hardjo-bovis str. Sponselee]EMO61364.1 hypothetical protein LEP1GSC133_3393 [Leptospira borgpetersenii serovar Pomona str. 200901868]